MRKQGNHRVKHIQEYKIPQRRKKGGLSNLDNDFTPGMTGQNLIVRVEHIVKLMHGIDDMLDLAYTKEGLDQRRVHINSRRGLPSTIIFVISANGSAGTSRILTCLLEKGLALSTEWTWLRWVGHVLISTVGTSSPSGMHVDVPDQAQGLAQSIRGRSNRNVSPVRGKIAHTVRK